jgi:putative sterol carrier protein
VAFFSDTEQFYACTRAVFVRMAEQDPRAGATVSETGMILRLTVTNPPAQITLDGRRNPVQTAFGESPLSPGLELTMAADTLHRILLGQLTGISALGAGLLKVRGPVWRVLALSDLIHHMQDVYPEVLREQGLA